MTVRVRTEAETAFHHWQVELALAAKVCPACEGMTDGPHMYWPDRAEPPSGHTPTPQGLCITCHGDKDTSIGWQCSSCRRAALR